MNPSASRFILDSWTFEAEMFLDEAKKLLVIGLVSVFQAVNQSMWVLRCGHTDRSYVAHECIAFAVRRDRESCCQTGSLCTFKSVPNAVTHNLFGPAFAILDDVLANQNVANLCVGIVVAGILD